MSKRNRMKERGGGAVPSVSSWNIHPTFARPHVAQPKPTSNHRDLLKPRPRRAAPIAIAAAIPLAATSNTSPRNEPIALGPSVSRIVTCSTTNTADTIISLRAKGRLKTAAVLELCGPIRISKLAALRDCLLPKREHASLYANLFFPRLLQELVPSPLLVLCRLRLPAQMHHLRIAAWLIRRPLRQTRSVRGSGSRKVCPIFSHQFAECLVFAFPKRWDSPFERSEHILNFARMKRAHSRFSRWIVRRRLIEPVAINRAFPGLRFGFHPFPCPERNKPVARKILP